MEEKQSTIKDVDALDAVANELNDVIIGVLSKYGPQPHAGIMALTTAYVTVVHNTMKNMMMPKQARRMVRLQLPSTIQKELNRLHKRDNAAARDVSTETQEK